MDENTSEQKQDVESADSADEPGQDSALTLEPKPVPGHSHDGVPKIFKFLPCALSMITGESGSGKSALAMALAYWFMNPPCGHKKCRGHVFSNVVVAQLQPDGTWDESKHPPNYHYIENWARFFYELSETLLREPDARALLIIDESATSLSAYSWQTESAMLARSLTTLKRKLGNLHIMVIAMQNSLILRALRLEGQEGGLLDIRFYKNKWAIEKWGGDLLDQGYDYKEIFIVDRPELEQPEALTFSFTPQICKTPSMCKPGDYCYSTLAQATWGLGRHPHSKDGRWNYMEMIALLSGVWETRIPELLYRYWHEDPATVTKAVSREGTPELPAPSVTSTTVDAPEEGMPETPEQTPQFAEAPVRVSTKKGGAIRQVEQLLLERGREANLSQIARECGVSQPFVSEVKKKMITQGRL